MIEAYCSECQEITKFEESSDDPDYVVCGQCGTQELAEVLTDDDEDFDDDEDEVEDEDD